MAEPRGPLAWGLVGGGEGAFFGRVHRMAARLDGAFTMAAGAFSSAPDNNRRTGADLFLDPARVYDDFREMARLEAARPDGIRVVTIATPNHLHAAAAQAFLDQGIHVLCEKPMTRTVEEAEALTAAVRSRKLAFVLAHTYTGYPMVREARRLVAQGRLGDIRLVQVEYAQDWLAAGIERTGSKQAEWRLDPDRSGPAGCLGDIGTHGYQLARYITGLRPVALGADLNSFGKDRPLDDDAHVRLRFAGGAKGSLWASQIAIGAKNALTIRVYGDQASLEWAQEQPEVLIFTRLGEPSAILRRGSGEMGGVVPRLPIGHPEGFLEALAQIYVDMAALIRAGEAPEANAIRDVLPGVEDGMEGMMFIKTALESSGRDGLWLPFPS